VLAQRLRVATADDRANVLLPDADTRQRLHSLAHRIGDDKCFSRHVELLLILVRALGELVGGLREGLMLIGHDGAHDGANLSR